jgi:uncharacterized membrane protein
MVTSRHHVDPARVQAAIAAAERLTSCEIVVSVARFFIGNVERTVRRAFQRLGVANTAARNGVLLFLVPSRHRFVVLADAGIHARVDPAFWARVTRAGCERFRGRDYTGGLVAAIETIGRELAVPYPHAASDVNELTDQPELK